jgi:hypothetical protein
MIITTKAAVEKIVEDKLQEVFTALEKAVIELDPKKAYILVVPESISLDEAKAAFKDIGKLHKNIILVQADNLRIIEIGQ